MPSASRSQRKKILNNLTQFPVSVKTIPSLTHLIEDDTNFEKIQDVSIADLLGRDPIRKGKIKKSEGFSEKTILVTGAGGSIGSELCKQVLEEKPRQLIIMDVSEYALYSISNSIKSKAKKLGVNLVTQVGSVQDTDFVRKHLEQYRPNVIYHAAAYKHVPLMEDNIFEAVKNNALGTHVVAAEAVKAKVENLF